jgi:hypothetical protein
MTGQMINLNIAAEFAVTPGPRKRTEGDHSGQEFLEDFLRPRFLSARGSGVFLNVNLNGAAGYPTSFLEEAFGGLARAFGEQAVTETLRLTCDDEPYIADDIRRYIREANVQR